MINKLKKINRGFTLMETLIAILIMTMALTGPLVMAQKGLQTALIAKDQDTAYYLAQDAIENIRSIRDTNCLTAGSQSGGCPAIQWLNGNGSSPTVNLVNCVDPAGAKACTLDVIAGTAPGVCASGVCPAINYDSAHNYFTYASGSASIFTRTITITTPVGTCPGALCNNNEATITVKVSWSDPMAHSVTVSENIYDWQ